ncbi:MAG: proline dehydrogenase family protein [Cyclobacteriaceae bacterium]
MIQQKIDFDDTALAFGRRSDQELRMNYLIFKAMNYPWLVKVGTWCMMLAIRINLPISGLLKKTIFGHFCGGNSLHDCLATINKLAHSNIKSILDYSAEGEDSEKGFEANKLETLKSIDFSTHSESIPISVIKLSGFVPNDLLEKVQSGLILNTEEHDKFDAFKNRIDEICAYVAAHHKSIFVDAEETWIQNVIDDIAMEMMEKYNQDRVCVFNTFQLYTIDALDNLKQAHAELRSKGRLLGAKIVRGAYMEKERDRAEEFDYPSPIQPNKKACDRDYNLALKYCIDNLEDIALCAGTHNEDSCQYLTELIENKDIARNHNRVYFAQLYGMSDNISFQLADMGYNVAKYVPYGPVKKVMPYLIRRAEENTAIAGQSNREFALIQEEIRRRKTQHV